MASLSMDFEDNKKDILKNSIGFKIAEQVKNNNLKRNTVRNHENQNIDSEQIKLFVDDNKLKNKNYAKSYLYQIENNTNKKTKLPTYNNKKRAKSRNSFAVLNKIL